MIRGSTIVLRTTVGIIAATTTLICLLTLSMLIQGQVGLYSPVLLGVYVSMVPFFIALYQAFKLLGYIDKNKAFSKASVASLKKIKYAACSFGALYALGLPYIYLVADRDDSPGSIVVAIVFAFGAFVAAAFVAVSERLFQNAVDIKSENDLTV